MGAYRLYFVNSKDAFEGFESSEHLDDQDAIRHAHALLATHPHTDAVEIWAAKRMVAKVSRNPAAPG